MSLPAGYHTDICEVLPFLCGAVDKEQVYLVTSRDWNVRQRASGVFVADLLVKVPLSFG